MILLSHALWALARGAAYLAGLLGRGERSHYIGFNSNGEIDTEIARASERIS